jgi:hypothetical protein
MPARKTTEQIDQMIENRLLCRVEDYKGYDTIILWKCNICSNEWKASPNNIISKGSGCPDCGQIKAGKQKSLGQYSRVQEALKSKNLRLLTPFTRVIDKHSVQCVECEHIRSVSLNDIVSKPLGKCPQCSGLLRLTNEKVDIRLSDHNRMIKRVGDVVNATTKIEWQCNNGHNWFSTPDSVLNQQSGCRYCRRGHGKGLQFRHILAKDPNAKNMYSIFYVLQFTDTKQRMDSFIKVGVTTSSIVERFRPFQYRDFTYTILKTVEGPLIQSLRLEQEALTSLREYTMDLKSVKFGGKTECFKNIQEVRRQLLL